MDSTIPLLHKFKISSFLPSSIAAQTGLCHTWSETLKTAFPASRLKFESNNGAALYNIPVTHFFCLVTIFCNQSLIKNIFIFKKHLSLNTSLPRYDLVISILKVSILLLPDWVNQLVLMEIRHFPTMPQVWSEGYEFSQI